ncbi:MAG: chromate transporter [Chthoniobacterales bacterium]
MSSSTANELLANNSSPLKPAKVSLYELAKTFLFIGITSVGGGLTAYVRRIIVENKGWLTDEEFFPGLALCQLLPGANVVGLALYIGYHLCGVRGAIVSTISIIAPPACILFGLGYLYFSLGSLPSVDAVLIGVAAVACGLMSSMFIESAKASLKNSFDVLIFLATFSLIKFAHVHVPYAILLMAPIAIWRYRPRS